MTNHNCERITKLILEGELDSRFVTEHTEQCTACSELRQTASTMQKQGDEFRNSDLSNRAIMETRRHAIDILATQKDSRTVRFPRPGMRTAAAAAAAILTAVGLSFYLNHLSRESRALQLAEAGKIDLQIELSRQRIEYELQQFTHDYVSSGKMGATLPAARSLMNRVSIYNTEIESELKEKG